MKYKSNLSCFGISSKTSSLNLISSPSYLLKGTNCTKSLSAFLLLLSYKGFSSASKISKAFLNLSSVKILCESITEVKNSLYDIAPELSKSKVEKNWFVI